MFNLDRFKWIEEDRHTLYPKVHFLIPIDCIRFEDNKEVFDTFVARIFKTSSFGKSLGYRCRVYNYSELKNGQMIFYSKDKTIKEETFFEEDLDFAKFKVELTLANWIYNS